MNTSQKPINIDSPPLNVYAAMTILTTVMSPETPSASCGGNRPGVPHLPRDSLDSIIAAPVLVAWAPPAIWWKGLCIQSR